MLSKTNTIHSRWIALALSPLSSLAIPSVAESSPRVVHVFVALADNQHQGIIPLHLLLGMGGILSTIFIGVRPMVLRRTSRPVRTGDSLGQVGARETRFWNVAFSRAARMMCIWSLTPVKAVKSSWP